jgi:hypothetical protein
MCEIAAGLCRTISFSYLKESIFSADFHLDIEVESLLLSYAWLRDSLTGAVL